MQLYATLWIWLDDPVVSIDEEHAKGGTSDIDSFAKELCPIIRYPNHNTEVRKMNVNLFSEQLHAVQLINQIIIVPWTYGRWQKFTSGSTRKGGQLHPFVLVV
jgi:hypothetical protein